MFDQNFRQLFLSLACLTIVGCGGPNVTKLGVSSADRIETDIAVLANDDMAGREAGTDGFDRAARYVSERYADIGLQELDDTAGYYQTVPMQRFSRDWEKARVTIRSRDNLVELEPLKDFFIGTSPSKNSCVVAGESIFIGYGIEAPEFGLEDLSKTDLKGKIVVFLSGAPDRLAPEERAHYEATKLEALTETGAAGYIRVYTKAGLERFPWQRLVAARNFRGLAWVNSKGDAQSSFGDLPCSATLSPDAASTLFENTDKSYADIVAEAAQTNGLPRGFDLNKRIVIASANTFETLASKNVIGIIPGTDPVLSGEAVLVTAHLDGLGIQKTEFTATSDNIYNGAMDNSAGVAILLDLADRFVKQSRSGKHPRRTLIFAALTAEEKGLIGADYLANHPLPSGVDFVANINIDMPILLHDFTDVIGFGSSHSTLGEVLSDVASELGLISSPDPVPHLSLFVRSDHYRFVRKGVPAIFMFTGFQNGGSDTYESFISEHYHQATDDVNLPIRYDEAAKFAKLNFHFVHAISESPDRPTWSPDSIFNLTPGPPPPTENKSNIQNSDHP